MICPELAIDSDLPALGWSRTVLGGELSVPCTRNPLSGAEFPFEELALGAGRPRAALTARSCAM